MAKVYTPNEQYTGLSAAVMFVNGVGETTDPHLIDWFRSKGYRVEEEADTGMTVKQIKERLDELGIEYNKGAKKAELLELLEQAESHQNEAPKDPDTETDADPSDETEITVEDAVDAFDPVIEGAEIVGSVVSEE